MNAKNVWRRPWFGLIVSGMILLFLVFVPVVCRVGIADGQLYAATYTPLSSASLTLIPSPTPTVDRLAQPVLPTNPTQLERGRYLYWLNCMPCHGDRGQGLTDEFRALYVEDANCWARGCHGGRVGDNGFPIPHTVPAIISSTGALPPFATPEDLFEFLRTTHPPQRPGALSTDQYWAITAYLLNQNGRLPVSDVLGR